MYHGLNDDYMPMFGILDDPFASDDPEIRENVRPLTPPYPFRLQQVIYGFGLAAEHLEREMLGAKAAQRAAG